MWWNPYGMVRLSVIYRGRAVPLVWCVLEHGSATVAYDVYKALVDKANTLMPFACKVVVLADRGCADTELMGHLQRLGWHCRLRIQSHFWIYCPGHGGFQVRPSALAYGQAQCWHGVCVPTKRFGSVPLAVARPLASDA